MLGLTGVAAAAGMHMVERVAPWAGRADGAFTYSKLLCALLSKRAALGCESVRTKFISAPAIARPNHVQTDVIKRIVPSNFVVYMAVKSALLNIKWHLVMHFHTSKTLY